ncbi:hypothetical protein PISL3812_00222 [Talaromyces islandicus]|uniref:DUF7704 domain-containing protein n=1 Tax=Talaromyces islandicus TaxID=28573 RepID=A0A0U1LKE0_TALIS|nr:hypothetical protein PISL3812_00222 [Talaromyces islandicus]
MLSLLPTWPFILFGIIEPLSMVGGFLAPLLDTDNFIAGQTPPTNPPPLPHHASTLVLSYQIANIYGLVGLLAVGVIYGSSERHVVRNLILSLAVADIGHMYAMYAVIGLEAFLDVASWSPVAWGSIGFTGFLFVNRVAYLLGAFGSEAATTNEKKRN